MQHVQRSRRDAGAGEAGAEEEASGGVEAVEVGVVGSVETEELQLKIARNTKNRMNHPL
jgi:hypothetical protein